jgi:hypothetical protein
MAFLRAATGVVLIAASLVRLAGAERINHEGRILGPVPAVTNAILFNTPQADAVISALQSIRAIMRGTKTSRIGRSCQILPR